MSRDQGTPLRDLHYKGWDFYNGAGTEADKKAQFRAAMQRITEEILKDDCAEISVRYTEPDWAGVRNVRVEIHGCNPCA